MGSEMCIRDSSWIPNPGEKKFQGISEEGVMRGITAQVCEVSKPLLSIQKLIQAGNRVVLEKDNAYIEDVKTGEIMRLQQEGGMYLLKLWVKRGQVF